jgi:hypothetical protein
MNDLMDVSSYLVSKLDMWLKFKCVPRLMYTKHDITKQTYGLAAPTANYGILII